MSPRRRCPTIHAAFYLWYATPEHDGRWGHWDHATLPHWSEAVRARFPPAGVPFNPPDEPHSPYYPSRGPYSSRDNETLYKQFRSLRHAGVDSVMLSWWGQAELDITRDTQGANTDAILPIVLDAASAAQIGVTWHLEPYGGRDPASVVSDIKYLHGKYGKHPALWKQRHRGRRLPIVFLYDVSARHAEVRRRARPRGHAPASHPSCRACRHPPLPPQSHDEHHGPSDGAAQWSRVSHELRGTAHDAIVLSLYLEPRDANFVDHADLDGAYTYFAARGFTHGSDPAVWKDAREQMAARGKLFAPSVGPGYNDSLIRPWNSEHARSRERGKYYDDGWRSALDSGAEIVTITSYNEWGEGTQIEEAAAHVSEGGLEYEGYEPDEPKHYMEKTRSWAAMARKGCVTEQEWEEERRSKKHQKKKKKKRRDADAGGAAGGADDVPGEGGPSAAEGEGIGAFERLRETVKEEL